MNLNGLSTFLRHQICHFLLDSLLAYGYNLMGTAKKIEFKKVELKKVELINVELKILT